MSGAESASRPPPVVVVGGGLAGLTAAYRIAAVGGLDVVVLEATERVGGKLRRAEVGGLGVDVGAESMLDRRPEGRALAEELGLPVVHPTPARPRVWTRGLLRPLPRTVLGVPADLPALAASGILSEAGLARARSEPPREPAALDADVSVGDLVAARLGEEVVERLVEPLLGGVYAGHAHELSARATTPAVVELAERGPLVAGAAALPAAARPLLAGISGGMARLAESLAASGRFRVRTGVTVREVRRTTSGFEVVTGPAPYPTLLHASHLVLATPPSPAARLLADLAPAASAELARIETASTAVVTMAFRAADLAGTPLDPGRQAGVGSGFLVPPVDGRAVKAATFSFAKWDWVRALGAGGPDGDLLVLRTSLGRHREPAVLQVPDEELVRRSRADLAAAVGLAARPVDAHVQRWGGGLPQYAVGHMDRVARIRGALVRANDGQVGRLAVCGAAYDGVGIPAVIASAQLAADQVLLHCVPPGSAAGSGRAEWAP